MPDSLTPLFPVLSPNRHGMLAVDDIHTIYWEECGNPDGIPVLFLHGGPGAGLSPQHRRFFDPQRYRVILFDQRGAGKSTPLGEWRNNTTQLLIADIERLRAQFGIGQWLVFGGSWGSTLALAYGQAHPEACLGFVLRGIFLCTQAEIDWFIDGVRWFYPELYEEFAAPIPAEERGDLLAAYVKRILSSDPAVYWPAARAWSRFEGRRVYLMPQPEDAPNDALDLGVGRLESHYMANLGFFEEDQLIRNIGRIAHLPAVIVQGRYDAICPPLSAYRLQQAWPGAQLEMIPDAGHGALEHGIASALVRATERFVPGRGFA
ncbi:prolyl aminopeptidase [Janthinobacterium lividum]|jgi:proline iminopeptidase|uniref:Proline iminopeptidase n=1 Tax=Janthinobacterium lividum TaxID=29581 RepID=A0ABU0XW32_9BURK|nr:MULTISPECIES: prolyl aminopeptidase [Janthinobacterium]KHA78074.1 proline iminopeptidase [Janthinobacterium lividum]MBR7633833.1 prolyl aminopeptidase [Janthinobacterium lividum]MDQ4627130.1 prolyl aminopeptidase [Janthinobacterium lividum]MDQ4675357.1 prolyl aminopeptidase [Janthinobacterium lividum]MDQ4686088.1 prolyl aminopeptidase [Janthinobacterium lividum]